MFEGATGAAPAGGADAKSARKPEIDKTADPPAQFQSGAPQQEGIVGRLVRAVEGVVVDLQASAREQNEHVVGRPEKRGPIAETSQRFQRRRPPLLPPSVAPERRAREPAQAAARPRQGSGVSGGIGAGSGRGRHRLVQRETARRSGWLPDDRRRQGSGLRLHRGRRQAHHTARQCDSGDAPAQKFRTDDPSVWM